MAGLPGLVGEGVGQASARGTRHCSAGDRQKAARLQSAPCPQHDAGSRWDVSGSMELGRCATA